MAETGVYPAGMGASEMLRLSQTGKAHSIGLVEGSPLRKFDQHQATVDDLCISYGYAASTGWLSFSCSISGACLGASISQAARQIWRMRGFTGTVCCGLVVGESDLAAIITLRLVPLAGAFALLFSTTTITEFRLALTDAPALPLCF